MDGPRLIGDVINDLLTKAPDEALEHYGVKGMHWGVRKKRSASSSPAQSEDSKRTNEFKDRAKAGSHQALSTKELQELVNRMNLEQQYNRLRPATKGEQAKKFIADTLVEIGKNEAKKYLTGVASEQIKNLLKK
jgi:hypothetical protein